MFSPQHNENHFASGKKTLQPLSVFLFALVIFGSCSTTMHAQVNRYWSNTTGSGSPWYNIDGNWSTGIKPTSVDIANFNQNASYDVYWNSTTAALTPEVGFMGVTSGSVTFLNLDSSPQHEMIINGSGSVSDFTISGSSTFLKVKGIHLHSLGGAQVRAGAQLNVDGSHSAGTTLSIEQDLRIAVSNGTGSSCTLGLINGPKMAVGGDIDMVTGTSPNAFGFLNVGNDSFVTANGNLNIGTGTGTSQAAYLSVTGSGALFTHSGAGSIDIGGTVAGNAARLDINGGTFTSATGTITIHETGILDVADGSFTANGPVVLESGGTFVIEQGDFKAKAGFDNTADGTIDFRNGTLTISGGHFEATPQAANSGEKFIVSGAAMGDIPKLVITSAATANIDRSLFVGDDGTDGELEVTGAATLTTTFNSRFGEDSGSTATVTVSGAGSLLDTGGVIGNHGTGTLDILDGGTVTPLGILLGQNLSGRGTINVVGVGSLLDASHQLRIGGLGFGRLYIRNGGEVQATSMAIGESVSSDGRVQIFFSNSTLIVDTTVAVAGDFSTASGGVGVLQLNQGKAMIGDTLKIWDTGQVIMVIGNPFLSADVIDNSTGGTFDFIEGTLQVESFIGDLVNQMGILAPGPDAGPTSITGSYTQQTDGTLAMEIGGTSPGGTHDIVTVAGVASLNGQLEISLINGFPPQPDDEILLLTAASISGFFDNIFTGQRLALTGGEGSFVVNYGVGSAFPSNQIVLSDFLPNVVVVAPDSFTVTRGDYVSGGIPELVESDNLDLSLRRRSSDTQSRTEFEVKSTSPIATPTSLELTLEGAVFARSNVIQTIELFDYAAQTWELVDTRNAARSPAPDLAITVSATGDLSRFVEAGSMCIEARIRYKSESTPRQNFASNTDQTFWTIE